MTVEESKIQLLYQREKATVQQLQKKFRVVDMPNVKCPDHETYLADVELHDYKPVAVSFYRIIGLKSDTVIATVDFTEGCNEHQFLVDFDQVYKNSKIATKLTVLAEQKPALASVPVKPQPAATTAVKPVTVPVQPPPSLVVEPMTVFQTPAVETVAKEPAGNFDFDFNAPAPSVSAPLVEETSARVVEEDIIIVEDSEPNLDDMQNEYVPEDVELDTMLAKQNNSIPTLNHKNASAGKKGGFFSNLFGKKENKQQVGRIFFFGDSLTVTQAQQKIVDVLKKVDGRLPAFDEVVTPDNLMKKVKGEHDFMLVADIRRVKQNNRWNNAIKTMLANRVRVADINALITGTPEYVLAQVQSVQFIDIKSSLYTNQHICVFMNRTGGVGKTTLGLNLAHWLASYKANTMYVEILGSAGIDKILNLKSDKLEDVLSGHIKAGRKLVQGTEMKVVALAEENTSIITRQEEWDTFFSDYTSPAAEHPANAVVFDTYTYMFSTRFLLPYASDIVIVSDMRQSTINMTMESLEYIFEVCGDAAKNKNIIVAHNRVSVDEKSQSQLNKTIADLNIMANKNGVKLNHVLIPTMPEINNTIKILDNGQKPLLIGKLVQHIYGMQI